jgi:hypothetical protein
VLTMFAEVTVFESREFDARDDVRLYHTWRYSRGSEEIIPRIRGLFGVQSNREGGSSSDLRFLSVVHAGLLIISFVPPLSLPKYFGRSRLHPYLFARMLILSGTSKPWPLGCLEVRDATFHL